jgi:predicted enzyme related to lactoylglutathione lyase
VRIPSLAIASFLLISTLATPEGKGADGKSEEKTAKAGAAAAEKGNSNGAKVTGIGGVFIKAKKDQKALNDWYRKNLGFTIEPWGGAILHWKDDKAEDGGITVFHVVPSDSKMFSPSNSTYMINFRIDNMQRMVEQLKANHVHIVDGPSTHENGKFLGVMDPEGNMVQLWEPKIWDDKNKGK